MRLIYLALGWAAGLVLAASLAVPVSPAWTVMGLFGASIVLRGRGPVRDAGLVILAFGLAGLRFGMIPPPADIARFNNQGGMTIEGVVVGEPDARDDRIDLRVAVELVRRAGRSEVTSGQVLVHAPSGVRVRYGDRVAATGLLTAPGVFDTFSYADYLARAGVYGILRETSVEVLSSGQGSPFITALIDLKTQAGQHIARSLPEPAASLLAGILLGKERGISPEITAAFNAVGAAHIVAISGFNMAVIGGLVVIALERLRFGRGRAAVMAVVALFGYALFVGGSASVLRAAIMTSLLVVGSAIRRKTYVPASLAFAVLVMSLHDPTVLWDVSFQLSFFATLGIALFAGWFQRGLNRLSVHLLGPRTGEWVGSFLRESLAVTLAAQAATLPLIILYFGRLSLVALVVNLLILPFQALIMVLGLISVALAFIAPPLAQFVFWFDLLGLSWTLAVVRGFARLPFADVEMRASPRLIALLYLVWIGITLMSAARPEWLTSLAHLIRRRPVIAATLLSGMGLVVLMAALIFSRPDGRLHLWALEMGHSNAWLARSPGGAYMLVDGGRLPSRLLTALGDLLPFNARQLDLLVVTQPDEFDYGALPAVLEQYDVGLALVTGQPNQRPSYVQMIERLTASGLVEVRAGYRLDLDDGLTLDVLHPQQRPALRDELDDSALVLRLTYGRVSLLLTGDVSEQGQEAILASGILTPVAVLQVPRHGGAGALLEAFMAAAQPQLALLQSDPANRFGDPDPQTLISLSETPLYRTDLNGALHLWTDGRELWVEPARGSSEQAVQGITVTILAARKTRRQRSICLPEAR